MAIISSLSLYRCLLLVSQALIDSGLTRVIFAPTVFFSFSEIYQLCSRIFIVYRSFRTCFSFFSSNVLTMLQFKYRINVYKTHILIYKNYKN